MRKYDENFLVATLSCVMAIVGLVLMRTVLKLDYQVWSIAYLATACTAAIRYTSAGMNFSVGSIGRAAACLGIGMVAIKMAGYPSISSFQTASLVPNEIVEALGRFHIYYEN